MQSKAEGPGSVAGYWPPGPSSRRGALPGGNTYTLSERKKYTVFVALVQNSTPYSVYCRPLPNESYAASVVHGPMRSNWLREASWKPNLNSQLLFGVGRA